MGRKGRPIGVLRRIETTRVSNCSFVRSPPAQGELLEPARKQNVATDGLPRLVDAEADQRNLLTIAKEAQRVQDNTLLAIRCSEDVMRFVDHQHQHADRFHDPQRRLLHLGNVGPRPLWRAEKGEELGVDPYRLSMDLLIWLSRYR